MIFASLRHRLAWFKSSRGALALFAWLTAVLLQTGAFGTVDTSRRYQVTRALWRGELPVAPEDHGFGIMTASGVAHACYGIGQSLLMLPGDLIAGGVTKALGIGPPLRMKLEMAITAFLTFPLVTAVTALLAYAVLRELGEFSERHALIGVSGWLVATSVLHYVQVEFENGLDLCATLAVICFGFRWAKRGSRSDLAIAALATGFDLLTRIPTLFDASLLLGTMVLARLPAERAVRRDFLFARARDLALVWLPIVSCALLADRAYQVARFGWEFVGTTYIHLYGVQERLRDPSLPPSYPFSGRFADGFWGPLISRNRSVFLFDPLATVGLVLVAYARARKRIPGVVATLTAVCLVAMLVRGVAFARLAFWDGSTSWSNRYTLTPVHVWALFALPTFLVLRPEVGRALRALFWIAAGAGLVLSCSSVLVHPNLEQIQANCEHRPLDMIPDRLTNVVREIANTDPDALSCSGRIEPQYYRIHLLPWDNVRDLPRRLQPLARACWGLGVLAWLWALAGLARRARERRYEQGGAASAPEAAG